MPDPDMPAPDPSARNDWPARLATLAVAVAAAALAMLVAVQGWQVFSRYVLGHSPSWIEPVTMVLLTTAMSFGAAAGVHDGRHFAFTLLADRASPAVARALRRVSALVVAVIGLVLAWWAADLFVDGIDVRAAGAPFPETLPFAPVALGGGLMALFALVRVVRPAVRGEAH